MDSGNLYSQAYPIRMKDLLASGALARGRVVGSTIYFDSSTTIQLEGSLLAEEKYLALSYTLLSPIQDPTRVSYKIEIREELGSVGQSLLYFICPSTGTRTRILYKSLASLLWLGPKAYTGPDRLYHPLQKLSRSQRLIESYKRVKKKVETLPPARASKHLDRLELYDTRLREALASKLHRILGK